MVAGEAGAGGVGRRPADAEQQRLGSPGGGVAGVAQFLETLAQAVRRQRRDRRFGRPIRHQGAQIDPFQS